MEEEFDETKMEDDLDEVSRVRRPGAALHNVIMALFLLLGESHREMADWKTLAQMLTQTKDPEKRPVPRMSRFDCEAVTRDQARLAKKLLAPLTVDKVKVECDAVTACFVWCKEKIQEVYEFRMSRRSDRTRTGYYQDIDQWCAGVTKDKGVSVPASRRESQVVSRESGEKFFCTDFSDENTIEEKGEHKADGTKAKHEKEEEDLLVLKWLVNNDKVL